MFPYIVIGQIKISTYYSAMVLGYLLMNVVMLLKERRNKYNLSKIKSVFFASAVLIFGISGCKILYILENIALISNNGLTLGGFSFYGAVFLIPLLMPFIGKLLNVSWRNTLDNSAICILAMLGTIRMGCFLNGCCGGAVFNIGDYYFTFPVQLIECVIDFFILCVFLKWEEKNIACGFFYPRFLILYGCARFMIELIRNTEKDWLYLSHAQWFSMAAIIIGIVFEIILRKQTKEDLKS